MLSNLLKCNALIKVVKEKHHVLPKYLGDTVYMFCLWSILPTILKESKYQLNKQVIVYSSVTIYANTTN